MIILAIDTSANTCSVALTDNETLKYEYTADHGKTHAVRLAGMIDEVLGESGMKTGDIDGFSVTTGPGSFTGLRIGIATVKGLAMAASKPVAAESTLEALAFHCVGVDFLILPFIDARKKEVYTAGYRWERGHLAMASPPRAASPDRIIPGIDEKCFFVGNGALLYRDFIEKQFGSAAVIAPEQMSTVRASAVALIGFRAFQKNAGVHAHDISPFYIRRSDAEKPRQL